MYRFAFAAMIALCPAIARADGELSKLIGGLKLDRRLDEPKPKPPMLPEGVRGKVMAVKDGSVSLNIGIDAGLENRMVIDVYREDRFLGTVLIERVYPKEAVGVFKPASGKAIKDLKADELPKAGDAVGKYYAKS